ncbi:serine/threonine-protein kinase prp4 [Pelomyxa schiedti]|nr:serine/threonine-protein kinase prp4 [Pelomyxa schiedti]
MSGRSARDVIDVDPEDGELVGGVPAVRRTVSSSSAVLPTQEKPALKTATSLVASKDVAPKLPLAISDRLTHDAEVPHRSGIVENRRSGNSDPPETSDEIRKRKHESAAEKGDSKKRRYDRTLPLDDSGDHRSHGREDTEPEFSTTNKINTTSTAAPSIPTEDDRYRIQDNEIQEEKEKYIEIYSARSKKDVKREEDRWSRDSRTLDRDRRHPSNQHSHRRHSPERDRTTRERTRSERDSSDKNRYKQREETRDVHYKKERERERERDIDREMVKEKEKDRERRDKRERERHVKDLDRHKDHSRVKGTSRERCTNEEANKNTDFKEKEHDPTLENHTVVQESKNPSTENANPVVSSAVITEIPTKLSAPSITPQSDGAEKPVETTKSTGDESPKESSPSTPEQCPIPLISMESCAVIPGVIVPTAPTPNLAPTPPLSPPPSMPIFMPGVMNLQKKDVDFKCEDDVNTSSLDEVAEEAERERENQLLQRFGSLLSQPQLQRQVIQDITPDGTSVVNTSLPAVPLSQPLVNTTGATASASSTGEDSARPSPQIPKKVKREIDMFSDSPVSEEELVTAKPVTNQPMEPIDDWDDGEGYYRYQVGEVIAAQYEVISVQGRGVFSTVLKAKDLRATEASPNAVVAIKVIRNNHAMFSAGQKEISLLRKLRDKDPEGKRHCIRMLNHFEFKSHLCIVFESMEMNLRELLKKFGKDVGINLQAVRVYAQQLFIALKLLQACNVCHSDIKLDNIVVNDKKTCVKLCDFGSAIEPKEPEVTTYLVSRFYRPPEIILGYQYDCSLDTWSIGCCISELFTGQILFPGRSNNEMLRLFMELMGHFPKKILRKCRWRAKHFDDEFNFLRRDINPITNKQVVRVVPVGRQATRDLASILCPPPPPPKGTSTTSSSATIKYSEIETRKLAQLKDLIEKCIQLDPSKRITPLQALQHPFITESMGSHANPPTTTTNTTATSTSGGV